MADAPEVGESDPQEPERLQPEQSPPDPLAPLHLDARQIFAHALDACRIDRILRERVRCDGTTLEVQHSPHLNRDDRPLRIPLEGYSRIFIIAIGKAAIPLTEGLLGILPRRPRIRGICAAPSRPAKRDWRIRYYAGGHPLPNQHSFRAARQALRLLRRATDKTLVLYLISGGGSTLFDLPLDAKITLSETRAFHQALVSSGATIAEINTLRKHFSAVKGGRLALAARAATKLTLQIIDVPPQHSSTVASGPTLEDPSTVEDCRNLLARHHLLHNFPPAVRRFFSRPDLPETPGDKAELERRAEDYAAAKAAGLRSLSRTYIGGNDPLGSNWVVPLLSNRDLVYAARQHATALGYHVVVDNACDDWPYDQAARYLVERLIELRSQHPGQKLCLLSGGEVTVVSDRTPGTGGRNQQFTLACALLLEERLPSEPVVCLSAGSDGVDGNSQAAGAVVDPTTARRARGLGFDPAAALAAFDSGPLLGALGNSVLTGPTGNNLRDIRILLSA
ncbi:MAG: D-glycerate 2-kinase [Acidobacteria bacterium]|nr:D-glycerate 2-kinase [Acidobacteriota bacterium]